MLYRSPMIELRGTELEAHRIADSVARPSGRSAGRREVTRLRGIDSATKLCAPSTSILWYCCGRRSDGVEQLGTWAMDQTQYDQRSPTPCSRINGRRSAYAVGSFIARMAAPGFGTRNFYRHPEAAQRLGPQLLAVVFERLGIMQLYRVSVLLGHACKDDRDLAASIIGHCNCQGWSRDGQRDGRLHRYLFRSAAPRSSHVPRHWACSNQERSDCPPCCIMGLSGGRQRLPLRRSEVLATDLVDRTGPDMVLYYLKHSDSQPARTDRDLDCDTAT